MIRQLGAGGMGVVFEAEDQLLNKIVAIKTIRKGFLSADLILRFQREATALAALNHPNLVTIYIFGITDDNDPYMVMSLESGTPLSELISKERMPETKAVKIFIQICDALKHSHERNVFHRDLKPSNVLIKDAESDNPHAVIIDFGIALVEGDAIDSLTKTGMMLGTPAYMSPEQINGLHVDARSDIYSLGCIMFEILTGHQPYSASSALNLLKRKTTEEAPKLNTVASGPKISRNLEEIVAKCLSLSKEDRYESMAALREDLELYQRGKYAKKKPPKFKPIVETKLSDRVKITAAVVTITGICSALIAVMMADLHRGASDPKITIADNQDSVISEFTKDGFESYDADSATLNFPQSCTNKGAEDLLLRTHDERHPVRILRLTNSSASGAFLKEKYDIPIKRILTKKTPIDHLGLERMSRFPTLEEISIRVDRKITAQGLSFLKNAPSLTRLTLNDCDLDSAMVKEICKISNLKQLNISTNEKVDDQSLKLIGRELRHLEELTLDKTGVTGKGLKALVGLKNLRKLNLRSLNLTNSDLSILRQFKGVVNVQGNNKISQAAIDLGPKVPIISKFDDEPVSD